MYGWAINRVSLQVKSWRILKTHNSKIFRLTQLGGIPWTAKWMIASFTCKELSAFTDSHHCFQWSLAGGRHLNVGWLTQVTCSLLEWLNTMTYDSSWIHVGWLTQVTYSLLEWLNTMTYDSSWIHVVIQLALTSSGYQSTYLLPCGLGTWTTL